MKTPCEIEPELWFSDEPDDQFEAMTACGFCPLNDNGCRLFAEGEIHGVWGGVLKGRTKTVVQPAIAACAWPDCNNDFVVRTKSKKFCSTSCQAKSRRAKNAARPRCAFGPCGKRFTQRMKTQRFCSPACGQKNKRATAHRTKGLHRLNELVEASK